MVLTCGDAQKHFAPGEVLVEESAGGLTFRSR